MYILWYINILGTLKVPNNIAFKHIIILWSKTPTYLITQYYKTQNNTITMSLIATIYDTKSKVHNNITTQKMSSCRNVETDRKKKYFNGLLTK